MKKNNTHTFAIYLSSTSKSLFLCTINSVCSINEPTTHHRITHILRMKIGETCIFFDQQNHIECVIESINKKEITVRITAKQTNAHIKPAITFFLPLLKREAFEEALYSLTELGATIIQPIITAKTHRAWQTKEHERSMRIIHAAAEQSKNFSFPVLAEPLHFERVHDVYDMSKSNAALIFFDPDGKALPACIADIENQNINQLYLFIGPEGDLTSNEKDILKKHDAHFCRLTPTIMRAQQAAVVALGAIRSVKPK